MANISAAQVKELREKTGAPMMDCKQALTEAKGDMEQAVVVLRKKGVSVAAKKATRVTSEGSVASYIHAGGKIGVLVEVNCESDFVARTEDFKELVHDIAMHIAASDPKFVRKEDVTPEDFEREKDIYRAQAIASGKPRTSRKRWSPARWKSSTKRSACWSSPSSRTRPSASRS
jgi:elongation factor Ts